MKNNYKDFSIQLNGTEKQIAYAEKLRRAAFEKVADNIEACAEDAAEIIADPEELTEMVEDGYFGVPASEVTEMMIIKFGLELYDGAEGVDTEEGKACKRFASIIGETDAGKVIEALKPRGMTMEEFRALQKKTAEMERRFNAR